MSETQKKPNCQPEIRKHQLSSRFIWKQSRKEKFGHFPLLEHLFFLVTRRYFQGKSKTLRIGMTHNQKNSFFFTVCLITQVDQNANI